VTVSSTQLHTIILSRLNHHGATRAYAHRRAAEGKTTREIKRCLAISLAVLACQQGRRVRFTTLAALANELQAAESRRELGLVIDKTPGTTGHSGQDSGEIRWPPMGRNSGHHRGTSTTTYGENLMATVTTWGPLTGCVGPGCTSGGYWTAGILETLVFLIVAGCWPDYGC